MNVTNKEIVALLCLKGVGRKSGFKFLECSKGCNINSEPDFIDFLLDVSGKKTIARFPMLNKSDIIEALSKADGILEKSDRSGIQVISVLDEMYPSMLGDMDNKPLIINYKGNLSVLENNIGITIIGTREPTQEGIKIGEYVGSYLAEKGINIISGLAKGCDTAGHVGALKINGITTGIVGHGLHMIYPKENKKLAEKIVDKGGLLLSEYVVGTAALNSYFVERDRLQSGLSYATIVIQTAEKGGTMHAVNATLKSGKLIAAIQFKGELLNHDKVRGNQMLIEQDKAYPLTSSNISEFFDSVVAETAKRNNRFLTRAELSSNASLSNKSSKGNSQQLNLF